MSESEPQIRSLGYRRLEVRATPTQNGNPIRFLDGDEALAGVASTYGLRVF